MIYSITIWLPVKLLEKSQQNLDYYYSMLRIEAILLITLIGQYQACKQSSDMFQTGFYSEEIQDTVGSFCQAVDLSLAKGQPSYTHGATFRTMEQKFGVMFGEKSFTLATKHLENSHQLSVMLTFYEYFEWSIVQVSYFISCDPNIYIGTYIAQEWNLLKCQQGVERQSDMVQIPLPDILSDAVVFLSGLITHFQNSQVWLNGSSIENGTLTIEYEYSFQHGFGYKPYPILVYFGYIAYSADSPYDFQQRVQIPHQFQIGGGRKHSNRISSVVDINNNFLQIVGLYRIDAVLNFYCLIIIHPRIFSYGDRCVSERQCIELTQDGGNLIC